MEVIKSGNNNIITCSKCNCQFKYDTTDVKNENGSAYVECPECHERIDVSVNKSYSKTKVL